MAKTALDLRMEAHGVVDKMDSDELLAFLRWYEEDPLTDKDVDALHAEADSNDWVPWRQIRDDF